MARRARAVVAGVLALGGVAPFVGAASAQAPCDRQCDADKRDAFGCCPGAPSLPKSTPRAALPATQPSACSAGQERSVDTAGHCCWPGQVWNGGQCVPAGWTPTTSTCLAPAPPGMVTPPTQPGSQSFAMDVTDVTVSAYARMRAGGSMRGADEHG